MGRLERKNGLLFSDYRFYAEDLRGKENTMDIRAWRRLAARSAGLLVLVLMISMFSFVQRYGNVKHIEHTVHAKNQDDNLQELLPQQTAQRQEATVAQKQEAEGVSDRYIMIPKLQDGQAVEAYLENDYMNFSISLTLEGIRSKTYTRSDIERVYRDETYSGAYQKGHDTVKKLQITPLRQEGMESVCIQMQLNDIYEPTLYETAEAYYISLEKPEDIYDAVVVIDAGHGGTDDGALSQDGKYCEKDYTLRIVGYLQKLLDADSGIKAYYTRLSDTAVTKADRVRLANAVHADAFVSVHCNASLPGDTSACGVETLYSSRKKTTSETLTSMQLSARVLESMCGITGQKSRGIIKRDGLYLMHHSNVPVTIVEVGYMSNQSDLRYLLREKNQKEMARGIYNGILNSIQ